MVGARLKIFALTTIATLAGSAAQAADYSPPPVMIQPPPQECCDNWYLRGFVGYGVTNTYKLDYQTETNASLQFNSNADIGFVGGAFGYDWNNWLRFDFSAEYRAKSRVYALGHLSTQWRR